MDWENSNSTMKTISRIVWNFFEQQAAGASAAAQVAEQAAPPEPIVLTPPPGYAAVKDEYIPVASTGFR